MRILSIGNSFSTDAQRWVHDLSVAGGHPIECVNLYIGGCTLKAHALNARENRPAYLKEVNGEAREDGVSLQDVLADGHYDAVTLQQASHASGLLPSYTPYADELAKRIHEVQPDATLYVHQTWAYDDDSNHELFIAYNRNRSMMYEQLKQAYDIMAMSLDAKLIPTGDLIHALRETDYFATEGAVPSSYDPDEVLPAYPEDAERSDHAPSLTRDGYHLNLHYGRYAAAALWYAVLTDGRASDVDWIPPYPATYPPNQKLPEDAWRTIRALADKLAKENVDYEAEQLGNVPDVTVMPGTHLPS